MRLPPLSAIFLSVPPLTWNPGSAPDDVIDIWTHVTVHSKMVTDFNGREDNYFTSTISSFNLPFTWIVSCAMQENLFIENYWTLPNWRVSQWKLPTVFPKLGQHKTSISWLIIANTGVTSSGRFKIIYPKNNSI